MSFFDDKIEMLTSKLNLDIECGLDAQFERDALVFEMKSMMNLQSTLTSRNS